MARTSERLVRRDIIDPDEQLRLDRCGSIHIARSYLGRSLDTKSAFTPPTYAGFDRKANPRNLWVMTA